VSRRYVSDDGVAPPCHLSTRTLTVSFNEWRILLRRLSSFIVQIVVWRRPWFI